MKMNFIHRIDAPSLSLIMPILRKSLGNRDMDTKMKAAKIVGLMSQLAEHKDLKPYLGNLMDEIQAVLLDPIPSTRAIAAKAVGSLVRGMGEEEFPALVPWLLQNIKSDAGKVERTGAAQGLAEVISLLYFRTLKVTAIYYSFAISWFCFKYVLEHCNRQSLSRLLY